jgi:hopanoid biosynthesis associated protein HpnK
MQRETGRLGRLVIINADDFGLSAAINRGIVEAHRQGIVTAASLLANGSALDDAIQLAKTHPELGIGIHLCLVEGQPVRAPESVPSLVGPDGRFLPTLRAFLLRVVAGTVAWADVEAEWRAQIERLMDAGLVIRKADSHMHLHLLPPFFEGFLRLCREYGIGVVRLPLEPVSLSALVRPSGLGLGVLAALQRSRVARHGLRAPDHFRGASVSGRLTTTDLVRYLRRLLPGVTEIMTHPGFPGSPVPGWAASTRYDRAAELAALVSPAVRAAIGAPEIGLTTFAALPSGG